MTWIKVSEQLPDNGDYILMTDGRQTTLGWFKPATKKFTQVNTWEDLTNKITHWMPLPPLPEDEE